MKLLLSLLFTVFIGSSLISQSVNDYKYVIVPEKFDFLNEKDQYQLNSLTTFLFNKYGFEAYVEKASNLPLDYKRNGCNTLRADVVESSGMLRTKLQVKLLDCNDAVVFVSEEGSSKLKEYKKSYHEALRRAFESIEELNYTYQENNTVVVEEEPTMTENVEKPTVNKTPEVDNMVKSTTSSQEQVGNESLAKNAVLAVQSYVSTDGAYEALTAGSSIQFFENSQKIGEVTNVNVDAPFQVKTTQFTGKGYLKEGRLIVERVIKGIADPIEMIFIKK
ncbi:hypothetical protein DCS32_02785 [Dokdonia sp. Dokd-P16]|uniref:hypothetical protein n=1 Tax=Dokdonia sp. Dokd-P16 TaxID=2173169 RepID=UPI000D548718|nr:hypothetical protein [Dokdonia sp. Dokd-P16]AWH73123.1 hypothetical protein DCS32_02785 [Dokdonia sp. Dokd-P16]